VAECRVLNRVILGTRAGSAARRFKPESNYLVDGPGDMLEPLPTALTYWVLRLASMPCCDPEPDCPSGMITSDTPDTRPSELVCPASAAL